MHDHFLAEEYPKKQSFLIPFFITVTSLIILAVHANYYMPFISDDALISLQYAKRFLQGHGLTWTDGIPVEGYTNLLWILLASLFGRFGIDLIDSVRFLGFICISMAGTALVYRHYTTAVSKALPMVTGLLILVLAAPVAVWTIGGLEQPLIAGLLAWALVLSEKIIERDSVTFRDILLPSVFLALLCIARSDGFIFTITVVFAIILIRGFSLSSFRISLQMLILPSFFYAAQLCFRLVYYGEWLPNTALVKVSLSSTHFFQGAQYVLNGFLALSPFSELALLFAVLSLIDKPKRARTIFLLVTGLVWLTYAIVIGGDIFPAWRHMIPFIIIMALVISDGMELLEKQVKGHVFTTTVIIILTGMFGWYSFNQFEDSENRRAVKERWEWNGKVIGLLLKRGFGPYQPTIAVTASGSLPYWSELPAIDMLGLNDYYLPRHPPEDFGSGWLGHELGDGQYVLDREPDLIVFRRPKGGKKARFLSGRQMQEMPEFYRLYTLVRFEGRDPYKFQSLIWVRRYSNKIGVQESDSSITIPSYLINGNPETIAYLDKDNQFVISLSSERPAFIKNLALPHGEWRLDVDSSAGVSVTLHTVDKKLLLANKRTPVIFVLGKESDYNLNIKLGVIDNGQTEVRGLIFTRLAG